MAEQEKKSGLKKFFQENRSLVFTIPVFIILVIVVVLVYVFNGNDTASQPEPTELPAATATASPATAAPTETPSDTDGTEVVTLPQDERDKDESEVRRNPFADPYKVSGIIYDKSGDNIAIIEAENKTYIVESGDEVDGYFKVLKIEMNSVVLEIDGMEVELTLSGE